MIIYDLECSAGHRFEGWFPSAAAFESQQRAGFVYCAVCGVGKVRRMPAGGHVGHATSPASAMPVKRVRTSPKKVPASKAIKSLQEITTNVDPVVLLKAVDHYVRTHFKNVGEQFASKALEIHQGTAEQEPIFGTATEKDRQILEENDVPFTTLPKLPESTDN